MFSNRKRFLGGIWPVVQRELRESARRTVNHRLRCWSGVAGALVLWVVASNPDSATAQLGGRLLAGVHTMVIVLILLIVPGLTADCLAREKRDGTLGLLFLTPLSAGGIVAGKMLAQGLRAFTLWLAVLPVLVIPFLAGGVNWFDAMSAVTLEFDAAILCLAAGLLASSFVRERNTALVLAFLLTGLFVFLYSAAFGFLLFGMWRGLDFVIKTRWILITPTVQLLGGRLEVRGGLSAWSILATVATRLAEIWKWLCLATPVMALLLFYGAARFATGRIERSWMDRPATTGQLKRLERFCTPLFRQRFRRKMQRSLDWNPIAWLQEYSWKARIGKWGLGLACVLVELFIGLTDSIETFGSGQADLLAVLGLIYVFVGVNSFLEEKRSGALELLLVTPLSVNSVIFGRAWGLWKQFGPGLLIVAAVLGLRMKFFLVAGPLSSYAASVFRGAGPFVYSDFGLLVVFCNFLTLPVFATYAALRVKNLMVAAGLTMVGALLPLAFAQSVAIATDWAPDSVAYMVAVAVGYAAFAALTCFLLRHSLSRRIYSF